MRLVLATANRDKEREIRLLLADYELLERPEELPEVEENGETLLENARLKARAVMQATGMPAIADDTGLEVAALNGAPGIRAARYAGEHATYSDNVAKLLAALEGIADRRARFATVALVMFPDGTEVVGQGFVDGRIATQAGGFQGFGYDPIFIPEEGDGRTAAEMSMEMKNSLSHRGRAFKALRAQLRSLQVSGDGVAKSEDR